MFNFRPGKKINSIPIADRNLIKLPYIYNYKMELRSYDDLTNPATEIVICLHLNIFSGGTWRSHDKTEIRYFDIETRKLYNNLGKETKIDANNIEQVLDDVIQSFSKYKDTM